MKKVDVLAIGTAVVDIYAKIDDKFLYKNKIKKGCTNNVKLNYLKKILKQIKPIKIVAGDNAKNALVSYKKCSGKSCAYISNVGTDYYGDIFKKSLRKNKIIDLCARKKRTGRIICLISKDKQRTFLAYLGDGIKKVKIKKIPSAKIFYFTNITISFRGIGQQTLKIAKDLKKQYFTKIAFALESKNLIKKNILKILQISRFADYIFLNQQELNAFEKYKNDFLKTKAYIFLKMGPKGSKIIKDKKTIAFLKAKKIKKIVDTTGAGDYFNGAVLYGIINNYSEKKLLWLGNSSGAKIIKVIGVED